MRVCYLVGSLSLTLAGTVAFVQNDSSTKFHAREKHQWPAPDHAQVSHHVASAASAGPNPGLGFLPICLANKARYRPEGGKKAERPWPSTLRN
jgi:hypothetical protein